MPNQVSPKTPLSIAAVQVKPKVSVSENHSHLGASQPQSARLKAKLIYNFRNLLTRPSYFAIFFLARFALVRQLHNFCLRFSSNSATSSIRQTDSLFDLDSEETVKTLQQDGVCLGLNLPSEFLASLQQYLQTQNCYAGGKPELGFKIADKELLDRSFAQPFYVARYFNLSTSCPQVIELAQDPKLLAIAREYIGHQAQYTGASLFWTFPIQGVSVDTEQQMFRHFHYDIDDFAGLRFCFYLTDVASEDGSHVCIRGSHIRKRLRYLLNFFSRIQSAAELTQVYPAEQFITIAGKSGTGFAEDTFCFHKGNPPQIQPRLFLQLHFAAHNYHQEQYLDNRDPLSLKNWRENLSSLAIQK
ncbi:MAG: hypothetical protein AAFQ23_13700 [Cyanobacteria bacterium J06623_1]